jgi:hypothetical protein
MCRDGPSCKRTICFFAHHTGELRNPPKKDRGDTAPAAPQEPRPGGPQLLAVHMDGSVAALTASAAGLSLDGGGPGRSGGNPLQAPSPQGLALAAAGQGYTIMPAPGVATPAGVSLPSGAPSQPRPGFSSGQQVMYSSMPPGYGAQQQHPMMLAGVPQGHAPGMVAMGAGVAMLQPQPQPSGHPGAMYVQQPQQVVQQQQQQQQQPLMGGMQQPYWVPVHQQQLYHPQQPHAQDQGMVYQLPDQRQMQQHPQQMVQVLSAGGQQQVLGAPPGGYMLVSPPHHAAGAASSAMYLAVPSPAAGASMGPMAAGTPPLTPGVPPAAASSSGASAPPAGPFPAWSGAPALSHPGVQPMLLVPASSPSVLQATTLPMPGLVGAPGGLVAPSPVPGNTQWVAAAGTTELAAPADGGGSGDGLPPGLS